MFFLSIIKLMRGGNENEIDLITGEMLRTWQILSTVGKKYLSQMNARMMKKYVAANM
jgi:hypothetical protein